MGGKILIQYLSLDKLSNTFSNGFVELKDGSYISHNVCKINIMVELIHYFRVFLDRR